MKAGTVQKVVLNMIGTGVFTRFGGTYRGRMVGVVDAAGGDLAAALGERRLP